MPRDTLADDLPQGSRNPPSRINLISSIALIILLAGVAGLLFGHVGAPTLAAASDTPDNAAANTGSLPSDQPLTLPTGTPLLLHVPADYPTIQAAVDHAVSGQVIVISPGIYHEAVRITGAAKSHLTLRGMDRNGVILDGDMGGGRYLGNAVYVGVDNAGVPANDVIVENMTARYYVGNGFYWSGVTGYRGSYLTAYNNGDYGIYAFASTRGQLDHDYASGSPDSGFYIGQCNPCNALVTHVVSEYNALGYSGTNAGGNLVLRDSIWRYNASGIAPNTLDSEKNPPEHGTTIIHNLVYANNNDQVPFKRLEYPPLGIGISVPGGGDNLIKDNIVEDQDNVGILVLGNIDASLWYPYGNMVVGNTVSGSGVADIGLTFPAGPDNCFSDNRIATTVPAFLQQTNACGTAGARLPGGDPATFMGLISRFVVASTWSDQRANALLYRWQTFRAPGPQTTMPGDLTAPARSIFTESWTSGTLDVADPHLASSVKAVAGMPLNSFFSILLGFYAYLLPITLFAAWVGIALWDLARRGEGENAMKSGPRMGWLAAVIAVPLLGAIAYYIVGGSTLSRGFRWMLVGGALAIWLIGTGVLMFAASLTA